jgi:hypothetical protein
MRTKLLSLAILMASACSGGGAEPGDDLYTLDLARYSPGQTPSALSIANRTLLFPLGVGPREQTLSAEAPGELVALDTRVGCNVNPQEWFGAGGVMPVRLAATAPVHLVEVTVDQFTDHVSVTASPEALAKATCVSFRTPDGRWHDSSRASKTTVTGAAVRTEFTLEAMDANAVVIFLSTYTYVSQVTYRVAGE